MTGDKKAKTDTFKIVEITFDEKSIGRTNPNIEHEREVAIFDLLEDNYFAVEPRDGKSFDGPYLLQLGIAEGRLVFNISHQEPGIGVTIVLSLTPLRRIIKDYSIVCDSYYQAIRTAPPARIETIDMGRKGLHNDGSKLLMERLKGKVRVDFATARRLFTLIFSLHLKG